MKDYLVMDIEEGWAVRRWGLGPHLSVHSTKKAALSEIKRLEAEDLLKDRAFMVYGDFTDPATGANFFVIRSREADMKWRPLMREVKKLLKVLGAHPKTTWDVSGGNEEYGEDLLLLKLPSKYSLVDGKLVREEEK